MKCGKGIHIYTDFSIYEGEFKNDKRNGHGKLTESNFAYYEGNFQNDFKHGHGIFVTRNHKVFDEVYQNGALVSHHENLEKSAIIQNQEQIAEKLAIALELEKKKSQQTRRTEKNDSPVREEPKVSESMPPLANTEIMKMAGQDTISVIQFNDKLDQIEQIGNRKPVKSWTIEEVGEILKNFGLQKYVSSFEQNAINGRSLLLLKERDFCDLGISSQNDIIIMRDLIKKIKKIKKMQQTNQRKCEEKVNPKLKKIIQMINQNMHRIVEEQSSDESNLRGTRRSSGSSIDLLKPPNQSSKIKDNFLRKSLRETKDNNEALKETQTPPNSEKLLETELSDLSIQNHFQNEDLTFSMSDDTKSDVTEESLSHKNKLDFIENIGETLKAFVIKKDEITLQEKIGEGLFGEVYKAKYNSTAVAVKILTVDRWSSQVIQHFKQEAEILCKLRSQYIILFMGICI